MCRAFDVHICTVAVGTTLNVFSYDCDYPTMNGRTTSYTPKSRNLRTNVNICSFTLGNSDIQWAFSQVKGTLDDERVTEGNLYYLHPYLQGINGQWIINKEWV